MTKVSVIAAACVCALSSMSAMASDISSNFYGDIQAQGVWKSGSGETFDAEIKEANFGVKGKGKFEDLNVFYNVSGQYSDNFDGVEVRNANVIVNTSYGSVFVGKGMSGSYKDVYKRVDIHPSNNADPASGQTSHLFEQGMWADNIACLVSPKAKTGIGTFQAKAAIITNKPGNDASDDVIMGRVLYSVADLNTVVNYLRIDEKVGPASATNVYDRWSVGADYSFGDLTLAAVAELTSDSFNGAKNTYVGAVSYEMGKFDFGVSYQLKTFEDSKDLDDLGLAIASVKYNYNDSLSFYSEFATYTQDVEDYASFSKGRFDNSGDNFSVGAIVKF